MTYIASVFGAGTARTVREAPSGEIPRLALQARPGMIGVLSRLARLDAARVTSPVPGSPLWAAEATDLARQAEPARAEREAPDVGHCPERAGLDNPRRGPGAVPGGRPAWALRWK